MRKLTIPLNHIVNKQFFMEGYGFFVESYPIGLEGYIIVDNDSKTVRDISSQRIIRYPFKFSRFFITTSTVHEENLVLWLIEEEYEFEKLPSETQYISVTISESDIAKETTLQNIASTLSTTIAKDTTLNNVFAKLSNIEQLIAKETTLQNIASTLSTTIAKDTTLNNVFAKLSNIEQLLNPYENYQVFTFTATAGSGATQTYNLSNPSKEIHVNAKGNVKIKFGDGSYFTPSAQPYKFSTQSITIKEDGGTEDANVEIVVFN